MVGGRWWVAGAEQWVASSRGRLRRACAHLLDRGPHRLGEQPVDGGVGQDLGGHHHVRRPRAVAASREGEQGRQPAPPVELVHEAW